VSQVEAKPSAEPRGVEELLVDLAPRTDTGEHKALGSLLRRLFGTRTEKPI
jgi:hypothetical protein